MKPALFIIRAGCRETCIVQKIALWNLHCSENCIMKPALFRKLHCETCIVQKLHYETCIVQKIALWNLHCSENCIMKPALFRKLHCETCIVHYKSRLPWNLHILHVFSYKSRFPDSENPEGSGCLIRDPGPENRGSCGPSRLGLGAPWLSVKPGLKGRLPQRSAPRGPGNLSPGRPENFQEGSPNSFSDEPPDLNLFNPSRISSGNLLSINYISIMIQQWFTTFLVILPIFFFRMPSSPLPVISTPPLTFYSFLYSSHIIPNPNKFLFIGEPSGFDSI